MNRDWLFDFMIGLIVGTLLTSALCLSSSTSNEVIVKHNGCAYFHPKTKILTWIDEDADKPDKKR